MTTLKQARAEGKIDQFIAEREAEGVAKGDVAAFNHGLRSMAGKSPEAPQASSPRNRGG